LQAADNKGTGKTQQKQHQDGWAGGTQEAGPEKTSWEHVHWQEITW